jgi:hypothetical protein
VFHGRLNDGLTYTGDMGPVTGNASGQRTLDRGPSTRPSMARGAGRALKTGLSS